MAQGTVGVNILSSIVGIGGSNVSAFGDLTTVQINPLVQLDFVYGLNSNTSTSEVVNTGVVTTSAGRLSISPGTNATGSASLESIRTARYRPGQGMMCRFSCAFDGGSANLTQVIGVGSTQVGYFFGYDGVDFGVSRRNGSADVWTAQSAWNGDVCDGTGASGFTWDKTNGNVVQILYPFLGYGNITYWVQDPATSSWILCHTIKYANSSASLQVSNPSFHFYANVVNTGNTTDRTLYCGSALVAVSGKAKYLGASYGVNALLTTVSTEVNILTIQNATTYNTIHNTGLLRIRSLSFSADGGNGSAICTVKKDATLGGTPSYTAVSGTTADNGVTITSGLSTASYDVAGTTVAGGIQVYNSTVARNGNTTINMEPYGIFIAHGETLTFSVSSQASADIRVAVNWNEDV